MCFVVVVFLLLVAFELEHRRECQLYYDNNNQEIFVFLKSVATLVLSYICMSLVNGSCPSCLLE